MQLIGNRVNIRHLEYASANAIIFYFTGDNLIQKNIAASDFHQLIKRLSPCWLNESVPAYDSCLIEFDCLKIDHHYLIKFVRELQGALKDDELGIDSVKDKADIHLIGKQRHHQLPVWYDRTNKETDLTQVAKATKLSVQQVITLHCTQQYRVFAVGFQPGFAYLGELSPQLALPRMKNPRLKVPKGAVAIAERQTAVYPNPSPGGWHLLGLCPLDLGARAHSELAFHVGDIVSFKEISKADYFSLAEQQLPC